jgi:hypothetical protein
MIPSFPQRCHERGPEALIEVFRAYNLIPNDRGEIRHLSASHAALIRSCGYTARAGQTWRCPPLPDEAVRGYPFFEHLTNAEWWSRRWGRGPFDWFPKRAQLREILPIDPLDKFDHRHPPTPESARPTRGPAHSETDILAGGCPVRRFHD